MAALRTLTKSIALKKLLITRVPVASTTKLYWNKDWKPGPYPKTPEERTAAAKKYGLLPEDYEPYPDDGLGFGDYPKLPIISADSRDQFGDWDFPHQKRNFEEVIHADADSHGHDRFDLNERYNPSEPMEYLIFILIMTVWCGLSLLGEKYRYTHPAMPKQMPEDGVVHYSFEPGERIDLPEDEEQQRAAVCF